MLTSCCRASKHTNKNTNKNKCDPCFYRLDDDDRLLDDCLLRQVRRAGTRKPSDAAGIQAGRMVSMENRFSQQWLLWKKRYGGDGLRQTLSTGAGSQTIIQSYPPSNPPSTRRLDLLDAAAAGFRKVSRKCLKYPKYKDESGTRIEELV